MINFVKKYCYIVIPIIISILFVIVNYTFCLPSFESKVDGMIGIIGTLIGFLLTAITIFTGLSKDNIIMKRVVNYNHHIIFARCILFGVIFSILTITLWVFDINKSIIILFFLLSFIETIMASWYIYKLSLFSIN